MSHRPFALASVLILGCVAGAATSQLVVPKARAGTEPTRWEYQCQDDLEKSDQGMDGALNAMGAEGWELVSAAHEKLASWGYRWVTCFKRPL